MFVCNVKMNKKIMSWILIGILSVAIVLVLGIVCLKFYRNAATFKVSDNINYDSLDVTSQNYTDILQDSHENINKYVGKKIKFVGFVYRLYDFSDTQFVLAREMIISSDNQTVVVGFLCECNDINNFENGTWIEVEGTIEKGNYHGDLPIVKITNLRSVSPPEDEYVFPPSGSYVEL